MHWFGRNMTFKLKPVSQMSETVILIVRLQWSSVNRASVIFFTATSCMHAIARVQANALLSPGPTSYVWPHVVLQMRLARLHKL